MEIDLLKNYPKPKRDLEARVQSKTLEQQKIARKFEEEFFDGDRDHGYGGFYYNPRFWQPVIPSFQKHWNIKSGESLLDIGCAKGFMLHDFNEIIPGLELQGIDISNYAIKNGIDSMRDQLQVASADKLPFEDNRFDYAISITTIHNFDKDGVIKALKEIERVTKQGSFITVDAYRNDLEKERMFAWNLTAKTILHVDEWKELFIEAEYTGDYFWFMP